MRVAFEGLRMRPSSQTITSVTRWLTVVVGCAVLETAQLMRAATPAETPARTPELVIFPQGSPERTGLPATVGKEGSRSWSFLIGALALASAGAWFLVKRRGAGPLGVAKGERKIVIEETRSLGNRQYLVVAEYEGSKFLIGVTAGQIQLVSPLKSTREST